MAPLLLLFAACSGSPQDTAGTDDTGTTEPEAGNYASLYGTWEGEFEQPGYGTYFGRITIDVEDAAVEDRVGMHYISTWSGEPWCTFTWYHQGSPSPDTWQIVEEALEDPSSQCYDPVPNFDEPAVTLTLLEDGTLLYEGLNDTGAAGTLQPVD